MQACVDPALSRVGYATLVKLSDELDVIFKLGIAELAVAIVVGAEQVAERAFDREQFAHCRT